MDESLAGEGVVAIPEAELCWPRLPRRIGRWAWVLGGDEHSRLSALHGPQGRWRSHSLFPSAQAAHSLLNRAGDITSASTARNMMELLTPSDRFASVS